MSLKALMQHPAQRFADGGTPKSRSQEILDYLLGQSPTATPVRTVTQMPTLGAALDKSAPGKYGWDPVNQRYTWIADAPAGAATAAPNNPFAGTGDSFGGDGYRDDSDLGGARNVGSAGYANDGLSYASGRNTGMSMAKNSLMGGPGLAALGYLAGTTFDAISAAREDAERNAQFNSFMSAIDRQTLDPMSYFDMNDREVQLGAAQAANEAASLAAAQEAASAAAANSAGYDYSGSVGGGLGGVGGDGTPGANGPGDGTAADYARGGIAQLARGFSQGGHNLGGYSDGGRLLRGPGDGVSDDIPAMIGDKQPARLADGEFVVPARIVSELGNGSTEAGARKLYAMMDRVQKARAKSVGKNKVAVNSRADKHLPA